MENSAHSSIQKDSILVSRNSPLALIIHVGGFIGSHLALKLLQKGVQVIGIDDLTESGNKSLGNLIKEKHFHLIDKRLDLEIELNLPRLDYAFFIVDPPYSVLGLNTKLTIFLRYILKLKKESNFNPKIVFTSSIQLYRKNLTPELERLKHAEVNLAKIVKEHKLNARIIRFASLFGPRMSFEEDDPMVKLLQASLLEKLSEESVSLEFSTRALYIDDAVDLILKSVLSGFTAHKIYDGVLDEPVKVSDIKQILLDPLWHEERGFKPSPLPPWPTPNLKKTIRELSWIPKHNLISQLRETIAYFKEHDEKIPDIEKEKYELKKEKSEEISNFVSEVFQPVERKIDQKVSDFSDLKLAKVKVGGLRKRLVGLVILVVIFWGLVFPIFSLIYGGLTIKAHLSASKEALTKGDFNQALFETTVAKENIAQIENLFRSFSILKRIGILTNQIEELEGFLNLAQSGIEGVDHGARGMQALYHSAKVMSGEEAGEIGKLYETAQIELSASSNKLATVLVALDSGQIKLVPDFANSSLKDLNQNLRIYLGLINKAKIASYLLPTITGVNGKKVYLVLLQNNMELRPTGGFIGSYGRIEFAQGKIKDLKVDDIYNLDGNLKEHIEPPLELKQDLGQKDFYLRDSNFDPDFPTSARQAQFFYKKETDTGENVAGVFALDLTASGKLIKALNGLDLPDYGENITEENLFEKVITHAEVNFFPGSQAKKNYLTTLQNQLFNKLFFLSNQNWPALVEALGQGLEEKHLLVYLADPDVFSYISSQNWSGILPRQNQEIKPGETEDFLAVNEANLGANKANYYLERSYRLETAIGKNKEIFHHLVINYKNNSPSLVFPAGVYKNRLRIYLPFGAKLTKATLGETDITKSVSSFSDYGRTGYSMLIEVSPKSQKTLMLDYQLAKPLGFKDGKNEYRLDVIKQPGTNKDNFEWEITYPINLSIQNKEEGTASSNQELTLTTDLRVDRSFLVNFTSKK